MNNRALSIVAIIALGSLLCLGVYRFKTQTQVLDDCVNSQKPVNCFSMKAHHLAASGDISTALTYAKEVVAPYSRNAVHMAMHMIGHAAYEQLQSRAAAMALLPGDALKQENLLTFEGYQHGVLQSYFYEKKDEIEIDVLIKESCGDYYSESELGPNTQWLPSRQCFHAVGHGLMTAYDNDIHTSIGICRNLPYPWMEERCAYGAFMELSYLYSPGYFPETPRDFVVAPDMAELCATQDGLQKTCSGFVGRSYFAAHTGDYKGAFDACEKTGEFSDICREDLAQIVVTGAGADFEKAKRSCSEAGEYEKKCLFDTAKAIGIGLAGAKAQKRNFCDSLSRSIRDECKAYSQNQSE